jgi:hypothetical protein
MIVVPHPASRLILHLINRIEQLLRQPVIANGSIESLNVCVLLRLPRLNLFDSNSLATCPRLHSTADIFRPVVAANDVRFPTLANNLLQRPNQSFSG